LVRDPAKRLDAAAALKSSWFSSQFCFQSCFLRYARNVGSHNLLHRLLSFADLNRFTKVALMVIAQHANHTEVDDSRMAFLSLDVCGRGSLGQKDIQAGFAACGHDLSEDDAEAVFKSLDVDENQRVSWDEWLAATLLPDVIMSEDAVKGLFNFFDADGNQLISHTELCRVIGDKEALQVLEADSAAADDAVHGEKATGLGWESFRRLMRCVAQSRSSDAGNGSRARRPCGGGAPRWQRSSSFPGSRVGETTCAAHLRELRRAVSGNERC